MQSSNETSTPWVREVSPDPDVYLSVIEHVLAETEEKPKVSTVGT